MIKVFISYSHDSDVHRERVLGLSERLRADGIETILDRYVERGSPPEGWPRWMLNALDAATHVLCVCTESYYRRFRGHEEPNKGKGVDWEGAVITQKLYDARHASNKFIPVLFDLNDELFIPEPLRSQTYYVLNSETNYQTLYDALLNQSSVKPRAIGELKLKPRITGQPLRFDAQPQESCSSVLRKTEAFRSDISHILKYAPVQLIGREKEIALLSDAWGKVMREEAGRPRIITFTALGGEGKTSLVAKWVVDEMLDKGWHDCNAAFAWSFYNQGTREQLAASSDLFLKEALIFFGDDADKDFAASPAGAYEKGQRLARIVGQRRNLLILDGLEPLQYAPAGSMRGELKDQGIAVLLKNLAQNSQGLCVATTRYSLPDLKAFWRTTAPEIKLERLSRDAGVHLLRTFDVRGAVQEFDALVEDVKGHALTLTLLGAYLRDAHNGDIRKRDLVKLEEADSEEQGGHAFRVMNAYAQALDNEGSKGTQALAILRLLGLFDRPATVECLDALWNGEAIPDLTEPLIGLSEAQRNIILKRLEDSRLLTVSRDISSALISLDAHPLLREYFAKQLREQYPDAWRAAHRRLYEYLCASTPDKPQPTLEDLQPLYQAIFHGCQAGLQQEVCDQVYFPRICKGNENYSIGILGAFSFDLGAIACFFENPWNRFLPYITESTQGVLLNQAANCLRALGRVTDALEPMRIAMNCATSNKDWFHAAIGSCNLSGMELTLGEVVAAECHAEQSVTYADFSSNAFYRIVFRANHADVLHQAGRWIEAKALFEKAEQMQAERQPRYPMLYYLQGFRYSDLLLAVPELAAWKVLLFRSNSLSTGEREVTVCRTVLQREVQTLQIAEENNWPFDIALGHLTLSCAELYEAILTQSDSHQSAKSEIQQAMTSFRRAAHTEFIVRGLLTLAWLRFLEGKYTGIGSAQADLDEAWEIAERGPMRLHMADTHLYRARLFGNQQFKVSGLKYPWESPGADLEAAEKLINTCGYHRRDEELADAKRALLD